MNDKQLDGLAQKYGFHDFDEAENNGYVLGNDGKSLVKQKYFEVEAVVSLSPVYSDGTFDIDAEHAVDNVLKYICVEYDENGAEIGTKEYDEKEFYKIEQDHPAGEWQNHDW